MQLIAKNNTCFRLLLDKNISPSFEEELKDVIELLELDTDQIKEVNNRVKRAGGESLYYNGLSKLASSFNNRRTQGNFKITIC